jgi:endonuclease III-like uncharacterized protein
MRQALAEARTSMDDEYGVRLEQSIGEAQAKLQNEFQTHLEEQLAERTTRLEEVKQEQMQQALVEAKTVIDDQYRVRLEQSIGEAQAKLQNEFRTHFEEELEKRLSHLGEVRKEIVTVSGRLESIDAEITAMLDDSSVELSKVIPKRTQQTELSAYLKGLRYSIGER